MFGKLFDFLQGYWEWIKYNVGEFFARVMRFFETIWSIYIIVTFVIAWSFDTMKATMVILVNQLALIVAPNPNGGTSIAYYLGLANTFFPLDETLAFIIGYALLIISLSTYKFIKSWMPKIFGMGAG